MVDREAGSGLNQPSNQLSGCADHSFEKILGFCKDCSCGICFRCAISKHRNHHIVNTDEVSKNDLEPMLDTFEQKLQ